MAQQLMTFDDKKICSKQRRMFRGFVARSVLVLIVLVSVHTVLNLYSILDRAALHKQEKLILRQQEEMRVQSEQMARLIEALNRLRGSRGRIQSIQAKALLNSPILTGEQKREIRALATEAEYDLGDDK